MDDLHCRIVGVDTAIAQIDDDLLRCAADVLENVSDGQEARLFAAEFEPRPTLMWVPALDFYL